MSTLVLLSIVAIGIEMLGLMDPTTPYMHSGMCTKLEQEGGRHCQEFCDGKKRVQTWGRILKLVYAAILPHRVGHDDVSENVKTVTAGKQVSSKEVLSWKNGYNHAY
jgi:hypothetical protein